MRTNLKTSGFSSVYVDFPNECPICKAKIAPEEMSAKSYQDNLKDTFLSILLKCPACYQAFICQYRDRHKIDSNSSEFMELLYCEPNRYVEKSFSEILHSTSGNFTRIYNQALAAETAELDEIAGMGYRKALEFLVKDYLISETPEEKETIEKMELGNCIANKISDENLKLVASRCAWLGNDETHYYRKHIDYGLEELKSFLDAVVYWISSCLATKAAMDITKK